ncbi:hypothetical protein B0H14DRAFT_2618458 [Mycena olivaceomarginata]|nr:hypothetical protein B0H14DRAFT_2618458 [Mycena olivaceomarginata]
MDAGMTLSEPSQERRFASETAWGFAGALAAALEVPFEVVFAAMRKWGTGAKGISKIQAFVVCAFDVHGPCRREKQICTSKGGGAAGKARSDSPNRMYTDSYSR